jgi:hypothetical protein
LDVDWENFGDFEADVPEAEDHTEDEGKPGGALDDAVTSDVFGEIAVTDDGMSTFFPSFTHLLSAHCL